MEISIINIDMVHWTLRSLLCRLLIQWSIKQQEEVPSSIDLLTDVLDWIANKLVEIFLHKNLGLSFFRMKKGEKETSSCDLLRRLFLFFSW